MTCRLMLSGAMPDEIEPLRGKDAAVKHEGAIGQSDRGHIV